MQTEYPDDPQSETIVVPRVLRGHNGIVQSVAFHPDGKVLATAESNGEVKLWSVDDWSCLATLQGHSGGSRLTFCHGTKELISAGLDKTVRFWNVVTRSCVRVLDGYTAPIFEVAVNPSGSLIAMTLADGQVGVIDRESGEGVVNWLAHWGAVTRLAFSPAGDILVTGGWDPAPSFPPNHQGDPPLKLWRTSDWAPIAGWRKQYGSITALAFSRDGSRLATAALDKSILVWDLQSGESFLRLEGHSQDITALAFAPDDEHLLSASLDKSIRVWNLAEAICVNVLDRHPCQVSCLSISPDGQWMASSGQQGSLLIWSLAELGLAPAQRGMEPAAAPLGPISGYVNVTTATGVKHFAMRALDWDMVRSAVAASGVAEGTPDFDFLLLDLALEEPPIGRTLAARLQAYWKLGDSVRDRLVAGMKALSEGRPTEDMIRDGVSGLAPALSDGQKSAGVSASPEQHDDSVELERFFKDFVGAQAAIDALKARIREARWCRMPLHHLFISADLGMGKSYLTRMVANAIGAGFFEVDCRANLTWEDALFQFNCLQVRLAVGGEVDLIAERTLVVWDHVDHLPLQQQQALQGLLNETTAILRDGSQVDMSGVVHALLASDPHRVIQSLKEQCAGEVVLGPYDTETVARIIGAFKIDDDDEVDGVVQRRWFTVRFGGPVTERIAAFTGANPKQALAMIKRYYRFLRARASTPAAAVARSNASEIEAFIREEETSRQAIDKDVALNQALGIKGRIARFRERYDAKVGRPTRRADESTPVPAISSRRMAEPPQLADLEPWMANFADPDVLQVFRHIDRHGTILESEMLHYLGHHRALRRFANQFEAYLRLLPFGVTIESTPGGKRYVKER